MQQRFLKKRTLNEMQGAILSIGESPGLLAHWINDPMTYAKKLDRVYPMVDKIDDAIQARASQISKIFHYGFDLNKLEDKYSENRKNIEIKVKIAESELKQHLDSSAGENGKLKTKWQEVDQIKAKLIDIDANFKNEKKKRRRIGFKRTAENFILRQSRYVPTTFRPLGYKKVTQLLYHGYCVAMSNASVMLDDFPLMQTLPKLNDFKELAEGNQRSSRPEPYHIKI